MKTYKLWVHQKKITDKRVDDILINPKEFSNVEVGDVLEIYHPEEEFSRLLLQVKTVAEDFQQKDTISIEQAIATAFQLRTYKDVFVNKVDPKTVALDLVEVLFKDQYFSRSDMNRMRNHMIKTCVYLNKKVQFSELRAQVNELWAKGQRVTCGFISEDTRMSSEMWDFDIIGDLYFEKSVNGFLTDLFAKWKEQNCCHDVTIVLFSRTFYEAQSRDEFPAYMQECLQQDYSGRFYEDFYRIVVQNERYEDWTGTLKQLRKLFNEYPQRVLHYHERSGFKIPKARNSTAAQGNFLETLNMTLNLFEKYNMDRNFDRTGKVAVVITPGAGVFEVDRELTNITKQRTIDCGIGSDLVCMGEQPLHAAPLFKFHSKNSRTSLEVGNDYNIPHWMNHSFYTSKNQVQFYSNRTFVPRIKVPPEVLEKKKPKEQPREQDLSYGSDDDNFPFVDYDEYDAQVFKLPARNVTNVVFGKKGIGSLKHTNKRQHRTLMEAKAAHVPRTRHISDDVTSLMSSEKSDRKVASTSPAVSIPSRSVSGDDLATSLIHFTTAAGVEEEFVPNRPIVGSAGSPLGFSRKQLHGYKRHRALINPFAPSRMQFKMTSYRRRWVHAFPTDPHGVAVQTHHVHTYSYHDEEKLDVQSDPPTKEVLEAAQLAVQARKQRGNSRRDDTTYDLPGLDDSIETSSSKYSASSSPCDSFGPSSHETTGRVVGLTHQTSFSKDRQQRSYMWGPTGEQEWSPELTTGVDWKSLTIPASLPITTDYLPDLMCLEKDYVLSDYSLLPDEVNSDYDLNYSVPVREDQQMYRKTPLTTQQVFNELISQRLSQGFQLIILPKVPTSIPMYISSSSSGTQLSSSPQPQHLLIRARPRLEQTEEVYLSIGRIFHKLSLAGPAITVIRYRPRHATPQLCYSYKYRFQVPDSYTYDVSWSEFRNEKLENYNWNYLDWYICTRGEGDYGLMDSLKFWRSRFFLLPCNNPATKKIIEGHRRCDIYEETEKTTQELKQLITGFCGYIEVLNKIRRIQTNRRQPSKLHLVATGDSVKTTEGSVEGLQEVDVLTVESPSQKLLQAMMDPQTGTPVLPKQTGLPEQCFISAEAVDWCLQTVKGVVTVKQAVQLLQRLLDEGLICHASGNPKHKIIYGFYLYVFINKEKSKPDEAPCYNSLFQNDWCEVAVLSVREEEDLPEREEGDGEKKSVGFYLNEQKQSASSLTLACEDWKKQTGLDRNGQTWGQQSATMLHKYVNVEVDPQSKSERPEWATARYHAYFSPKCAFELQIQWVVSTGAILGELVTSWARKAATWGFHLLPVPVDPFALPTAPDSDPLRGPIFVPLNVGVLTNEWGGTLFQDDEEETKALKLLHLQDTIVKRYGFMPSSVRIPSGSSDSYVQYEEYQQYVHCTGGMFVLIEDCRSSRPLKEHKFIAGYVKKSSSELRKDYILRQTSHTNTSELEMESKFGFLWSWNFMSSKRWRSGNTGDEHFQDRVLADFRDFCSNREDRLRQFWEDYRETYHT